MTWSPSTWPGGERTIPPFRFTLEPIPDMGSEGHPKTERDQQNKAAFMLKHFFPKKVEGALLALHPIVQHVVKGKTIEVTVTFPEGSKAESGRIWWIFDRAPDGSPKYLTEMIPNDQTLQMNRAGNQWKATIRIDPSSFPHRFFQQPSKNPALRRRLLPVVPIQSLYPGRAQTLRVLPMIRVRIVLACPFASCWGPAGQFFPTPRCSPTAWFCNRDKPVRIWGKGRRRRRDQSLAQWTRWKNHGQEWRMVHNL